VRSVDFGFILQNVELCHFKRIVPQDVLQASEWHSCQVQVCCCCSPNVMRGDSTSDTRSLDCVSKYPAQVVVISMVAFEPTIRGVAQFRDGAFAFRAAAALPTDPSHG
jgi:hypothetical protein